MIGDEFGRGVAMGGLAGFLGVSKTAAELYAVRKGKPDAHTATKLRKGPVWGAAEMYLGCTRYACDARARLPSKAEVELKRFSGHLSLRSLEVYIAHNREAAKRKARSWERQDNTTL